VCCAFNGRADSSKYGLVGGTYLGERKKPVRKQAA
jgi:hypothetical protein